jgi:RNA polymerase sigma-70 factor (ECF subfamily)
MTTLDETVRDTADAALLVRLRAGDPAAFETLVRTHGGRLLAVARRLLRDEEDARDALQEAFVNAFKGLAAFEGESRLSTWLHSIVVNAALMRLRRRRRKPEQALDDFLPTFLEDGHQARPPAPWRADAHRLVEQRETREFVHAAIDRLPESYRTVLILRDVEELDTEASARALGITPNLVKVRLHRARQALRTLLSPRFERGAA